MGRVHGLPDLLHWRYEHDVRDASREECERHDGEVLSHFIVFLRRADADQIDDEGDCCYRTDPEDGVAYYWVVDHVGLFLLGRIALNDYTAVAMTLRYS